MHLYWVLGFTILMADSQSEWDVRHCQFPESDQEILLTNQVAVRFCSSK
jgi:hypothetical protein